MHEDARRPVAPKHVYIAGRVVPAEAASVSVLDRGLVFGESVYEVCPVIDGVPRLLGPHVERMKRGVAAIGLDGGVPHEKQWREIASQLVEREGVREGLFYAQVTGGAAPRIHVATPAPAPTFFAHLTPFYFPRADEDDHTVSLHVVRDIRWNRCDLKTTLLLPAVMAKREAQRHAADEALWVGEDGSAREGASSNVFVVRQGAIETPALGPHVLPGIVRNETIDVARSLGVSVAERELSLDDLSSADEVFVTSTGKLVAAVGAIDDEPVGGGRAGDVTRRLAAGLRARLGFAD